MLGVGEHDLQAPSFTYSRRDRNKASSGASRQPPKRRQRARCDDAPGLKLDRPGEGRALRRCEAPGFQTEIGEGQYLVLGEIGRFFDAG